MQTKEVKYSECPICVQKRNTISWVSCPKCSFSCCRTCVKTFLLEQPDIVPRCMSCKTGWDFEFVANNTDHSFHNKDYRDYRAKILVERERSLLPATQDEALVVKKEKEYDALIRKAQEELSLIRKKEKEILNKLKDIKLEKSWLRNRTENKFEHKTEEKSKFVSNCPQKDCNGFLNDKYVCGICEKKACRKCRSQEHEGECDKELLETIQMLARDTRNCPNCKIPIYRISGCSQMFCVKCNTAFCWNTGKIETGRIHNPHYYQFIRQNGDRREIGDVPCGGRIPFQQLHYNLVNKIKDPKMANIVVNSHQISGHIRAVTLPQYNQNDIDEKKMLRVKYLLGELNDKTWMQSIKKMEKRREKYDAISMILTMFANTLDDIHRNLLSCSDQELENHIGDIVRLRDYVNVELKKIGDRFDNKVPIITDSWNIVLN
jgi:hypothetical protein